MHLDDWLRLTPAERQARQARWQGHRRPGADDSALEGGPLLEEAARRFEAEYRHHADIVRVDHSAWFSDEYPLRIFVATRLKPGQMATGVPWEYMTFAVAQDPIGDDIQAHKDTWSAVLSRLFDWPEAAIADFLAGQDHVWENSFLLHDPPCADLPWDRIITSLFENGRELPPPARRAIKRELESAIGGDFYLHREPEYDWGAARERVAQVVEEYRRA